MKAIGGFLEFELNLGRQDRNDELLMFNSARNALAFYLINEGIQKIQIPYFICDAIYNTLQKYNISYDFYRINENLEIIWDSVDINKPILYVNYFGIMDNYLNSISYKINHLIIDQSQAYFSNIKNARMQFYSPRKFFGIADGGILKVKNPKYWKDLSRKLPVSKSSERYLPLLQRIDEGSENAYENFQNVEREINNLPIEQGSNLTKTILGNIKLEFVANTRINNFENYHLVFKSINKLNINLDKSKAPLAYPLFLDDGMKIRKRLIENKIFVAKYWPNVKEIYSFENEKFLADNIIPLPIDQRYSKKEIDFVINKLKEILLNE